MPWVNLLFRAEERRQLIEMRNATRNEKRHETENQRKMKREIKSGEISKVGRETKVGRGEEEKLHFRDFSTSRAGEL